MEMDQQAPAEPRSFMKAQLDAQRNLEARFTELESRVLGTAGRQKKVVKHRQGKMSQSGDYSKGALVDLVKIYNRPPPFAPPARRKPGTRPASAGASRPPSVPPPRDLPWMMGQQGGGQRAVYQPSNPTGRPLQRPQSAPPVQQPPQSMDSFAAQQVDAPQRAAAGGAGCNLLQILASGPGVWQGGANSLRGVLQPPPGLTPQQQRWQRQLERQAWGVHLLLKMQCAVMMQNSQEQQLNVILGSTAELLQVDIVALHFWESGSKQLKTKVHQIQRQPQQTPVDQATLVTIAEGIAGRVLTTGESICIDAYHHNELFGGAALCLPLYSSSSAVCGSLTVMAETCDRAFTPEDQAVLNLVAPFLASCLWKTSAFDPSAMLAVEGSGEQTLPQADPLAREQPARNRPPSRLAQSQPDLPPSSMSFELADMAEDSFLEEDGWHTGDNGRSPSPSSRPQHSHQDSLVHFQEDEDDGLLDDIHTVLQLNRNTFSAQLRAARQATDQLEHNLQEQAAMIRHLQSRVTDSRQAIRLLETSEQIAMQQERINKSMEKVTELESLLQHTTQPSSQDAYQDQLTALHKSLQEHQEENAKLSKDLGELLPKDGESVQ